MKLNLYFLRYNNKYNRIIKKLDTIEEYNNYLIANPFYNINFQFGDGIVTKQVINNWAYDENPDYLVLEDTLRPNKVHSRWFVVDCNFLSNGIYEVTLKRDSVADNIDKVLTATSYIEKGTIPADSPLIYNKENMSFNEIKTEEYTLKNKVGFPWLIAYLARKSNGEDATTKGDDLSYLVKFKTLSQQVSSAPTFPYSSLVGTNEVMVENPIKNAQFMYNDRFETQISRLVTLYEGSSSENTYGVYNSNRPVGTHTVSINRTDSMHYISMMNNALRYAGGSTNAYTGLYNYEYIQDIVNEIQNKRYSYNGKICVAQCSFKNNSTTKSFVVPQTTGDALNEVFEAIYTKVNLNYSGKTYYNEIKYNTINLTIELIPQAIGYDCKADFSFSDGAVTSDAPYEIVAIPYADLTWIDTSGVKYNHTKELGKAFIEALGNQYGNNWCYDVQLVPYIRWDKSWKDELKYDGTGNLIHIKNSLNENISFAFRLDAASFKVSLSSPNVTIDSDKHRSVTCDRYRLVSPNGQGDFEFSPVKNGGLAAGFEADVTLKPYNPYINIHPVFGKLYGASTLDDYRGLICGGDFGLARLSNEWKQYELNNKNYQQTFNRQVETMDKERTFQRIDQLANSFVGAGGAGVGIGALTSNPALGGVAAGLSAVSGIADLVISEERYNIQRQNTIDYHNWELGNVKARAQSLGRVTGFNIDNKLFPYLEYYTCTDEEKNIYDNIVKYKGMTVECIGRFEDYINGTTYIKGQLIDIDGITDDSHIVSDINEQLNGGLRIDGNTASN